EIVEGAAVILRVDDVEGGGRQFGEIAGPAHIGELGVVLEIAPQRRRRRLLAALDQLGASVEDAGMDAVAEMLRQQEFGYPLIGAVVDENGPNQGHLDLDVAGGGAVAGISRMRAGIGWAEMRDGGAGQTVHRRTIQQNTVEAGRTARRLRDFPPQRYPQRV